MDISGNSVEMIAQDPEFTMVDEKFLSQHGVSVLLHPKGFGAIDDFTFLLWLFVPFREAFAEIFQGIAPLSLQTGLTDRLAQ